VPARAYELQLLGAAFMASGAVLSNWSSAQELPGGVATDLFEQAMQEELTVPDAENSRTDSIVTVLTWIAGLGAAALAMYGLRGGQLRPRPEGGVTPTVWEGPDAAPEATRTEVEVATVRRPKRPSKPKEVLKLPPHVVAFLQKTAAKRAAAAADQAPAGSSLTGGLDVIVPGYDPSRADD